LAIACSEASLEQKSSPEFHHHFQILKLLQHDIYWQMGLLVDLELLFFSFYIELLQLHVICYEYINLPHFEE
jgi:hypothetical protein